MAGCLIGCVVVAGDADAAVTARVVGQRTTTRHVGRLIVARTRTALPLVPLPPAMPHIVYANCPGLTSAEADGCYIATTNTIYLVSLERFVRMHELGHAVDAQLLTDADRWRFARMIGDPVGHWRTTVEVDAMLDPPLEAYGTEERFADAYANCALHWRPHGWSSWESEYGYDPSNRLHRHVCALIARSTPSV